MTEFIACDSTIEKEKDSWSSILYTIFCLQKYFSDSSKKGEIVNIENITGYYLNMAALVTNK